MEKYGRVLVIIFFLCLINIGLSIYTINQVKNPQVTQTEPTTISTKLASPASQTVTIPPNIQSDLTLIKAEIRTLRDALDVTGLILETPAP